MAGQLLSLAPPAPSSAFKFPDGPLVAGTDSVPKDAEPLEVLRQNAFGSEDEHATTIFQATFNLFIHSRPTVGATQMKA